MADAMLIANIGVAAAIGFIIWRCDSLRGRWVFHVVAIAVIAAMMTVMSLSSDRSNFIFSTGAMFRIIIAGAAYVPFVVFLVIIYGRLLGDVAGETTATIDLQLSEIEDEIRYGHTAAAIKALRRLLQEHAADPGIHKLMAEAWLERQNYESAVTSLRLAAGCTTDDAEFTRLVFKTSEILDEYLGNTQAAARELDQVRQRMPDTPSAEKAQNEIRRLMSMDAEG